MVDLNEPTTWANASLASPPDFDSAGYQKRLNAIFGLSRDNRELVRLIWAWDKRAYSLFYTEWTQAGFGTKTEPRSKYRYATLQIPGTSDYIDIPPPRWIIEQREEPAQYLAAWEQTRWSYVQSEGKQVERRPPPPRDGYYSHLLTVADHDGSCCREAREMKVVCWGFYRLPDETDLEVLREAKAKRDADAKAQSPYEPLTKETLLQAAREADERAKLREELVSAKTKEFVDENALELIGMFTGVEMTEQMKKFSIPANFKTTESGLIIPG
jgi:hypothetical protein